MALVQDTSLAEKDFFLIIWMTKLMSLEEKRAPLSATGGNGESIWMQVNEF